MESIFDEQRRTYDFDDLIDFHLIKYKKTRHTNEGITRYLKRDNI